MKKQLLSLFLVLAGFTLLAQTPRVSLFEEFTGETCPPCASTNPGLDALLMSGNNPSLIIPIKWQVPIPSAPTPTWSLYRTNKTEIDWRYRTVAAGGYGYNINSAPSCRIDGQSGTVFGMPNDHPGNLNSGHIQTAASATTAFGITMNRAWNANATAVSLTVNIAASANFVANGNLVCRVVLIENEIKFPTQPGTNGEKDFNWVVRKSYPVTSGTVTFQQGTDIPDTWTNGQTQTFVLNCVLPSYIREKSEVAFVAFIQDDGNRMVWQAGKTPTEKVQNDAKAVAISVSSVVCTNTVAATAQISNAGSNAITSLTVVPTVDGVMGTAITWNGNLAVGASTNISLGNMNVTNGGHTYSVDVTGVNAGDLNIANNTSDIGFFGASAYSNQQVIESFSVATFPPSNWGRYNPTNGLDNWNRVTNAGMNSLQSAKVDFFNISSGTTMDLILPPMNIAGSQAPMITFDVAYAQYSSENDRLQVLASTDCGATWDELYTKAGSILKTSNAQTTAFTPSSDGQWRNEMVEFPMSYTAATNVIVKFRATSNFGNNLYLDNVNLMQMDPVGINTVQNTVVGVELFPNPTKGATTLRVETKASSAAVVSVVNVLGQVVYSTNLNLEAGMNTINIDAAEFASGVYNVVIGSNSGKTVKKLSVN